MSGFSGVLQLTDLDDFITPSQECVMPTDIKVTKMGTGAKITIGDDGDYYQINGDGNSQKLQKVEITLADCLACSGCITSAESVLITQQSQEELLKVFEENQMLHKTGRSLEAKLIIISLSVQPIISLAVCYNLTPNECAAKLCTYFKSLGADMVVDMTVAEDFALLESQDEFIKRYRETVNDGVKNILPMLASSCPGWVCYAEKTHGNYILPYISTTKSPQQIMGTLIKKYVRSKQDGREIYHATVMPCYDKKLEASRNDFFDSNTNQRDVDCVITAIELEQMLTKSNVSLETLEPSNFSEPWLESETERKCELTVHTGSGSGGYADNIFKYAAQELFNLQCDRVEFKQLRNPDFREAILEVEGKVVLRFAIANGFRNIQNLVQKLKRGKSQYHYVEIMACPSGCLNGGALVRPKDGKSVKELQFEMDNVYAGLPTELPKNNQAVKEIYTKWLGGIDTDKANSILHTEYHAVAKANNSALNIKW